MGRATAGSTRPRASILLFSVRGIPVFAHATLPLGLAFASQLSFRPMTWLGVAIVILVHEGGHAALLRLFRCSVLHVVLHGFGGECAAVGHLLPWQRAFVAWGGVLAQGALLGLVLLGDGLGALPEALASHDLHRTLTVWNVWVALFNLLPVRGLDGGEAWSILRLGYLQAKLFRLQRRLARMAGPGRRPARRQVLH